MKVILLDNVKKIGQKNQVVEVNDGYAINFLIKNGLAKRATTQELAKIKSKEAKKEKEKELEEKRNQENYKRLNKQSFSLKAKASEKGHLFAGIHKKEIAKLLNVDEKNILLDKEIKELGEYSVEIQLGKLKAKVNILIKNND